MVKMYNLEKQLKTKRKVLRGFVNEKEVIDYLKENNLSFSIPYIFTHINLSSGEIITQHIKGFLCSPEELRKLLEKKE